MLKESCKVRDHNCGTNYRILTTILSQTNGFDLTGWLRKSGVFAVGVRRPIVRQGYIVASRTASAETPGMDGKLQANHWRAKARGCHAQSGKKPIGYNFKILG